MSRKKRSMQGGGGGGGGDQCPYDPPPPPESTSGVNTYIDVCFEMYIIYTCGGCNTPSHLYMQ